MEKNTTNTEEFGYEIRIELTELSSCEDTLKYLMNKKYSYKCKESI